MVLAGGGSARFGDEDKLTAIYRDRPLVHHAVLALAAVCDDVIVVLAPNGSLPGLPPEVGIARDPTEGEGPLAGLHAGLLAAVRSELALVVGGDMPGLEPAVLRAMLQVAEDAQADAVALRDGDRVPPLPVVLRTWPAAEAAHTLLHAGRRSLHELIHALRTTVIDEPTWTALDPERRTLLDVDEPSDLEG